MKQTVALLVFFFGISLNAQEINNLDEKGRRHGSWKGVYEESKRPRYEGTFNHGAETGTFRFFEDNEKSTLAATREFNSKDGSCYTVFYDDKGNMTGEGREVAKQREGQWKFYHPGSKDVLSVEQYSKGKLTGIRKVYYPKGTIAEEAQYVNGLKEGIYKKYTEKGIVLEESRYKADKLHGPAIFRDSQGQVGSQGQFTNGKKTGKWKIYENGKFVKEVNMSAKRPPKTS